MEKTVNLHSEQAPSNTLTMGAGKGAAETTAATEPVRRPGPLPSNQQAAPSANGINEMSSHNSAQQATSKDIVSQLRENAEFDRIEGTEYYFRSGTLELEAADEIERLQLQVYALTNANKSLADRAAGQPPNRHTVYEPPQASNTLLDTWNAWLKDAESLIESGVATDMIAVCPVALRRLCTEAIARASHEPPVECPHCNELIDERDRAQDALQETHIALGGDGEWTGKLPPQSAPDSGDLHLDVPELAGERMAELERLRAARASQPPAELWGDGTREMLIELRDWMRAKMPCNAGDCCSELRGWIEKVDKHITHHAPAASSQPPVASALSFGQVVTDGQIVAIYSGEDAQGFNLLRMGGTGALYEVRRPRDLISSFRPATWEEMHACPHGWLTESACEYCCGATPPPPADEVVAVNGVDVRLPHIAAVEIKWLRAELEKSTSQPPASEPPAEHPASCYVHQGKPCDCHVGMAERRGASQPPAVKHSSSDAIHSAIGSVLKEWSEDGTADTVLQDDVHDAVMRVLNPTLTKEPELAKGCHRSHPHEDMNSECERLTAIARARAATKEANDA